MGKRVLETTVKQKGQVTIPLTVRKDLGIKPRDRVRFERDGDSYRVVRATSRVIDGYGSLAPYTSQTDGRVLRDEFEQGVGAEVREEA